VRYGIVAYRVTYRTVNATGRAVLASGLVVFPGAGPDRLPVVSYAHGTTATKADVPSSFGLGADHAVEGRWTAELFASAGFAVTEPDYVGMGSGTGPIEYLVAKSEATASSDLLTAAKTLAARHGDMLERGVLVTGFSQGGSAAMALGRALASGENSYLRLRALAPVSGPYDLAGAELPGLFNGQVAAAVAPYYIGYALTSWNPLYHLYTTPAQAFREPYAAKITRLFDGNYRDEQIPAALPSNLPALLTPDFLGLLRRPHGELLRASEANSTCTGWTPPVPVRLYAASGDTTVTQVNAEHCARYIQAHGGNVRLIQVGHVDHSTSDILALPKILRWFLGLR
jgi:predicted dienelactone hydrolase